MIRLTYATLAFAIMLTTAASAQAEKTEDCFCTDSTGHRVELGQSICLTIGGRSFTAQCQMSLNSPMWREMNEGCLSSQNAPLPQSLMTHQAG